MKNNQFYKFNSWLCFKYGGYEKSYLTMNGWTPRKAWKHFYRDYRIWKEQTP